MYEPTVYRKNHNLYRPFADFEDLDKLFFGDRRPMAPMFRTDIKDNGDNYLLEADLPGFKKEDIKLDLDGDYLTISAQRSNETEDKDEKSKYVRKERFFGSFTRSFDVSGIKTDAITAKFEDGVLKLTMPKAEPDKPAVKHLNID